MWRCVGSVCFEALCSKFVLRHCFESPRWQCVLGMCVVSLCSSFVLCLYVETPCWQCPHFVRRVCVATPSWQSVFRLCAEIPCSKFVFLILCWHSVLAVSIQTVCGYSVLRLRVGSAAMVLSACASRYSQYAPGAVPDVTFEFNHASGAVHKI